MTAPGLGGTLLNRTQRPLLRRWLVFGLIVLAFCVAALALTAVIGAELGAVTGLLAGLVAVLPVAIVLPLFLWLDAYEAEPRRLVLLAFGWGALISTTTALVLNTGSMLLLATTFADPEAVAAVVVAPVVEESLKGLGILFILVLRRDEFDGVIDGIVYAGVIACGFAFAENILYLGRAYNEAGAGALFAVFVLRGIVSPFAHPLFTVATGVGIGAALHRGAGWRVAMPAVGLVVAIALHAAWNFSSVAGAGGFFHTYLLVQVPIFVAFLACVVWARYNERATIRRHLQDYADYGWLSPAEVSMLTSVRERRTARKWARSVAGARGKAAMQAFQDDAVELAMIRRRMLAGASADAERTQERLLLQAIGNSRAELG